MTKETDMIGSTQALDEARRLLEGEGYVVLKRKSYEDAQRRQWRAEGALDWAERESQSINRWAHDALDEARRLRDRLTFVYGVARARGASVAELSGSQQHLSEDLLQKTAVESSQVMEFVHANKKIQAIKALRDIAPCTLKEAKDAIESEAVWGVRT